MKEKKASVPGEGLFNGVGGGPTKQGERGARGRKTRKGKGMGWCKKESQIRKGQEKSHVSSFNGLKKKSVRWVYWPFPSVR